jgi:hypothetical protein
MIALLIVLLTGGTLSAQPDKPVPEMLQWYYQHYPFVTMKDTIYTLETEYDYPEGFYRPDSSDLTPFQSWVSRFPLWHQWKPVGHWKGQKLFEHQEISRVVHLPWRGDRFTDQRIPLRILGEWLFYRHRESELRVVPKVGDTLRYEDFLGGELRYNNRMVPFFHPTERREPSSREYYRFMLTCLDQTSHQSLAANCDTITAEDLAPGDLLIAHDETGKKGRVYVVLLKLVNDEGERLFVVACGCEEACDFHIPLLTEDRHRPWVTAQRIEQLAGEFAHRGLFRFRIQ